MFSRFKDFLYRHRRKFVVTGVVVGGTVFALRYAQRKLREYTENEAKEFIERNRRQQHFKSTERTCDQTILSLFPTIHEALMKAVNTEELVAELQTSTTGRIAIWEELKVKAFTQIVVQVYAGCMLVLLLRVQLNLVGGLLVGVQNHDAPLTAELQQIYLSLCHHLRDTGVKDLCKLVEQHVQSILENVSLKKPMSLRDTEELFWSIQNSVEGNIHDNPITTIGKYVMPQKEKVNVDSLEDAEVDQLFTMMAETMDLLESEELTSLMRSCVSQCFAAVVDQLADQYAGGKPIEPVAGPSSEQDATAWARAVNESTKETSFVHPSNVTIPVAKLIPIINRLREQVGSCRERDTWVHQLIRNDLVKVFGANVYEAFGQKK